MTLLDDLLEPQSAYIAVYEWVAGDVYAEKIPAFPVTMYAYNAKTGVFGFVLEDLKLHAFVIRDVHEQDDQVVFETGVREFRLEAPWNSEQEKRLQYLRSFVAPFRKEQMLRLEDLLLRQHTPEERLGVRPYTVLYESKYTGEPKNWHFVGAWAGGWTETGVPDFAFWSLPEYAAVTQYEQGIAQMTQGSGKDPVLTLGYLDETAGTYRDRSFADAPFDAPSAERAAHAAAILKQLEIAANKNTRV